MKKKTKLLLLLAAVLLCLILPGFYNGLKVVRYDLTAAAVSHPVRIALVTDLHSCAYGKDQSELLDAVDAEKPDLVLLGGDIFDDELPDGNAAAFLREISGKYMCYYVTGNHEYWSGVRGFADKMDILRECGINRLDGRMETVELNGTRLNICGIDDPYAWGNNVYQLRSVDSSFRKQLERVAALPRNGAYTILLTHRPELFDLYSGYGFDLVLAGHAHGGQWRIPGIINGVYAPNQGLFPEYAGGKYRKDGTVMVVSRGLARESTRVPRFYNRPELVTVVLGHE